MALYNPRANLLWWSQTAGSTTLAVAGTYHSADIDLRDVCDVLLVCSITGTSTGTSPTLTVNLDVKDPAGQYIASGLALTAITTAPATGIGSAGIHIASTGSVVLPEYGRVTWVLGGTTPVYPNASIALYGR